MWRRESGLCLQAVDELGDLVDGTAVRRRPAPPLITIHRSQLALFVGPLIPDGHAMILQVLHVAIALQKPEQFIDDRAQVQLFGRHRRETGRQIEAHLIAKNTQRPRSSAIFFANAFV
jgi:hypothetical protein